MVVSMAESCETVVIGAGPAGLAVSYFLTQGGHEHLVLERGRVAETWRTERWDGFYLNTPNWAQQLPGHFYRGGEPDGFAPLGEVIDYLESYAAGFGAPVRTGAGASTLRCAGDGEYVVEVDEGDIRAVNVVVATGAFQRPTPNPLAGAAPAGLFQLHTSVYRSPAQLPAGAVLVVGSGQSGCQIADELIEAGRVVYLCVGRCPWVPRRYRGRELVQWMIETGLMDQTVDTLPAPSARFTCNPPVSGSNGGHDCHPRWLARRGAVLLGRLAGFRGGSALLAPDLEENLARGDEFVAAFRRRVDDYVTASGLDVPEEAVEAEQDPVEAIGELDLGSAGIGTILWANGYRPDFGWIDLPVLDDEGWPAQTRGVTACPGVYFVGLHWLHKRKSALFLGVGDDAEYVASSILSRSS
jgi:putative flavoprotein involved in K+ transport